MSVGQPFIASDVDGVHEMTQGAGLLFAHGDDKQLAELIVSLMNDREYYHQIAAQCMERARQYDISRMAEGYIGVYEELLGLP